MNIERKSWLQKVTNKQLEKGLLILSFVIMLASVIDGVSEWLVLVMIIITPFISGYGLALLLDYMDHRVEYAVVCSDHSYIKIGAASSVIAGIVLANLADRFPLVPFTQWTSSLFEAIAPSVVFLLIGIVIHSLGFWFARSNMTGEEA